MPAWVTRGALVTHRYTYAPPRCRTLQYSRTFIPFSVSLWNDLACGTCHMASSFLPLSRTTTTAICSSSNLLVATLTQHIASHPTSGSLLTTSSPLPIPLIVTSHPDQKRLMPLLALLLISIRDALLTTYALLPSHLSVLSSRIPQALILIILNSKKNFYCRNGVLAMNIINTDSASHQRCQHPTKGALLLAPSNELATFPALLLIAITFSRLPLSYQANSSQDIFGNLTTC